MTLLLVVVALAVVAGVAVLVSRDRPLLADDPVGARALRWPPEGEVSPDDLAGARFTVALRGYRMDEVDRVLDDARTALAERDRRIARLEGVQEALSALDPGSAAAPPTVAPADAAPPAAGPSVVTPPVDDTPTSLERTPRP